MPYPDLLHPEPMPLWQSTVDLYLFKRHSNTVLSQSLWGLWDLVCTRFVWTLGAFLVGIGFDSKYDFTSPTVLLGLLCPWTWGISLQLLQLCAAASPPKLVALIKKKKKRQWILWLDQNKKTSYFIISPQISILLP